MLEKIARYSLAWAFLLATAYCYGYVFYYIVWHVWHI